MFIIELTYKKSLEEVEKHLETHKAFIKTGVEAGYFMMAGPKVPRTGGIVLADFKDLSVCHAYFKQDSFYQHDIAEFKIIEFISTMQQNK